MDEKETETEREKQRHRKAETKKGLQRPPVNPVMPPAMWTEAENSRLPRDFTLLRPPLLLGYLKETQRRKLTGVMF